MARSEARRERRTETYILIANTGAIGWIGDGHAAGGRRQTPVVTQVPLKAQSRTNVPVSGLFPAGTNAKFGALIESNGVADRRRTRDVHVGWRRDMDGGHRGRRDEAAVGALAVGELACSGRS